MQFRIAFDELQSLIARQTSKNIQFLSGDTHTLRVAAEVNVLFKSTSLGIDINVDRVEDTDLWLSYSGGMAIEMALKMALGRLDGAAANIVELQDGCRMVVHLGRSPQLATIFDKITLRDICFDSQFVIVDFSLRNPLPQV